MEKKNDLAHLTDFRANSFPFPLHDKCECLSCCFLTRWTLWNVVNPLFFYVALAHSAGLFRESMQSIGNVRIRHRKFYQSDCYKLNDQLITLCWFLFSHLNLYTVQLVASSKNFLKTGKRTENRPQNISTQKSIKSIVKDNGLVSIYFHSKWALAESLSSRIDQQKILFFSSPVFVI